MEYDNSEESEYGLAWVPTTRVSQIITKIFQKMNTLSYNDRPLKIKYGGDITEDKDQNDLKPLDSYLMDEAVAHAALLYRKEEIESGEFWADPNGAYRQFFDYSRDILELKGIIHSVKLTLKRNNKYF